MEKEIITDESFDTFNKLFNDEIEKMSDAKIVSLTKLPGAKIDKDAIKNECKNLLIKQIEKMVTVNADNFNAFYDQLKMDNLNLYSKIIDSTKDKVGHEGKISLLESGLASDIKLESEDLMELQNLGMQWFKKEDWHKAYLYFSFLAAVERNDPVHFALKGMAAQNLGQFAEALGLYDDAIALAPQYEVAQIQKIKCLIAANQTEEAKHQYDLFSSMSHTTDEFLVSELASIKNAFSKVA